MCISLQCPSAEITLNLFSSVGLVLPARSSPADPGASDAPQFKLRIGTVCSSRGTPSSSATHMLWTPRRQPLASGMSP